MAALVLVAIWEGSMNQCSNPLANTGGTLCVAACIAAEVAYLDNLKGTPPPAAGLQQPAPGVYTSHLFLSLSEQRPVINLTTLYSLVRASNPSPAVERYFGVR